MGNDIRGLLGPKFSWHLSYGWGKIPWKTSTRKMTRPGIESKPARWEAVILPLDPSGGQLRPWRALTGARFPCNFNCVTPFSTGESKFTIAPKLLYGRKICDLAELLTPLATHTLLYSRSPRKTFKKNPPVSSWRCDCVATSTNLKIFIAIISTILL